MSCTKCGHKQDVHYHPSTHNGVCAILGCACDGYSEQVPSPVVVPPAEPVVPPAEHVNLPADAVIAPTTEEHAPPVEHEEEHEHKEEREEPMGQHRPAEGSSETLQ